MVRVRVATCSHGSSFLLLIPFLSTVVAYVPSSTHIVPTYTYHASTRAIPNTVAAMPPMFLPSQHCRTPIWCSSVLHSATPPGIPHSSSSSIGGNDVNKNITFTVPDPMLARAARWQSFRERTTRSIPQCTTMLALTTIVDFFSTLCLCPTVPFQSARANFILGLETLWKLSLGFGLWLIHSGNKRFIPPDTSERDRLVSALKILAFLWRKTAWVLVASCLVNIWGTFGAAIKPSVVVMAVCAMGSLIMRQVNYRETKAFRNDVRLIRATGLLVVRNMALCTFAFALRGVVGAICSLFRSTVTMQEYHLSGIQTPFVTAGLLWKLRRAFFRAVVTNSGGEDEDEDDNDRDEGSSRPILVPEDLMDAQDKFYSSVSTILAGEAYAKATLLMIAFIRSKISPEHLEVIVQLMH